LNSGEIFILCTFPYDVKNRIVQVIIKEFYTHVSIALDNELNELYSFRRNITRESLELFPNSTYCALYSLKIKNEQYILLRENIKHYLEIKSELSENRLFVIFSVLIGLPLYRLGIYGLYNLHEKLMHRKNKFNCSSFITHLLRVSRIEPNFSYAPKWKKPIYSPHAFTTLAEAEFIYTGLLKSLPAQFADIMEEQTRQTRGRFSV
jgi:hypothetical protein